MGKPVSELRLFGTRGSPAAYTIRDFLQRSDVPFRWVELTTDEQARTEANVEGLSDVRLPICMFPDGTRLERPTVRQVTETLGCFFNPSQAEYDLAIYGGGPAGLSAAVYGASEGLKTVLIERSAIGGQAATSSKIENYLGFPDGITGADLAERARKVLPQGEKWRGRKRQGGQSSGANPSRLRQPCRKLLSQSAGSAKKVWQGLSPPRRSVGG